MLIKRVTLRVMREAILGWILLECKARHTNRSERRVIGRTQAAHVDVDTHHTFQRSQLTIKDRLTSRKPCNPRR